MKLELRTSTVVSYEGQLKVGPSVWKEGHSVHHDRMSTNSSTNRWKYAFASYAKDDSQDGDELLKWP